MRPGRQVLRGARRAGHALRAGARRGFTLVEMLVVVAIVVVLLAVAGPSFLDFIVRQRVQAAASELVTDIQWARTEAVSRGEAVVLYLRSNADLTCYTVQRSNNAEIPLCDCRSGVGSACAMAGVELRTAVLPTNRSVRYSTLSASLLNNRIEFGAANMTVLTSNANFQVDVIGTPAGRLRVLVNRSGRPTMCTPDGSFSGVAACP
jgi:type IV fimbrial biogenesis protein FimT